MPFENLGDKLQSAFKDLRGKGKLSESDIDALALNNIFGANEQGKNLECGLLLEKKKKAKQKQKKQNTEKQKNNKKKTKQKEHKQNKKTKKKYKN